MTVRNKDITTLIERYIQLINITKPLAYPIKDPQGSLELDHLLWMLVKMLSPTFVPLTTYSAWITWVQAGLYQARLINIKHEIDITREILGRSENEFTEMLQL